MEISTTTIMGVLLSLMLVIPGLSSLPLDVDASQDEDQHIEQKRPKYMDTRELERLKDFKELVLLSLRKLAKENMIKDIVVDNEEEEEEGNVEKRRRHIGMCLRRSGRHFLPYPCYKYSGRR